MKREADLGIDLLCQPQLQFYVSLLRFSVFKISANDFVIIVLYSPNNIGGCSVGEGGRVT